MQRERAELSAASLNSERRIDRQPSVSELLSAMAQWRSNSAVPAMLRRRIQAQIETYFGSQALPVVEAGDMTAEQLLVRTNELLNIFLGQTAAESVQDETVRGLDTAWR